MCVFNYNVYRKLTILANMGSIMEAVATLLVNSVRNATVDVVSKTITQGGSFPSIIVRSPIDSDKPDVCNATRSRFHGALCVKSHRIIMLLTRQFVFANTVFFFICEILRFKAIRSTRSRQLFVPYRLLQVQIRRPLK